MSLIASDNSHHTILTQSHPDWVSMDIDKLGKSFYNSDEMPLSDTIKNLKAKTLKEALMNKQFDVLEEYSRSTEGLINNELRSRIWPVLLGIGNENEAEDVQEDGLSSSESSLVKSSKLKLNNSAAASFLLDELSSNDLPPHKDEDQVKLDIQRSFTILVHLQSFQNHNQNDSYATIYSRSDIDELKKTLQSLIIKILRKYPSLNYYQGYHDIASTIMIVCNRQDSSGNPINEELAFRILEKLTIFHLRDFMITDINLSVNHLKLIPTLLEVVEPSLFELIRQSSNSYIQSNGLYYDYNFYQGLSSVLTFFSHDLSNLHQVLVLWDFTLSYDSILVNIYIYVSILIFYKEDIFNKLNLPLDDFINFENVDQDLVHTLISPNSLFSNMADGDLIKILNKTKSLIENYPINDLNNSEMTFNVWFKEFNKNSVLLNTSDLFTDREIKNETYQHFLISDINFPNSSLNDLIQVQDEEMSKQTIYNLTIQNQLLEQQEELSNSTTTDYETSHLNSLSSSISSLTSVSTSINTKIVTTSSILFRKWFDNSGSISPDLEDKDKKLINRNKDNQLFKNIYKISFTISFIGFMIHFLLIRNNPNLQHFNIFRYFGNSLFPFKQIGANLINNDSINTITGEIGNISGDIANEVGDVFHDVYNFVKGSEFVNYGINIGQVGLGNLRSTIYWFVG